jgi:hypothetical protein
MPLVDVPQFSNLFTQISPLEAIGSFSEYCLESKRGVREDLDTYCIDDDKTDTVDVFRHEALRTLAEKCAVTAYRPTEMLMDILYPRIETAQYLGMFHGHQAAFEHKAWVETELKRQPWDVLPLPWRYYADSEKELITEFMAHRKVLRANRTDGGVGLALCEGGERTADLPPHVDRFIGATEFLEGAIPLNINACVFPQIYEDENCQTITRQGGITLHSPSLQLIGLPSCTTRRFGYCGNDFAAFTDLEQETIRQFAEMTTRIGTWLASKGYVGAFGVDALLHNGTLYLTEVNPRFQGSSCLASELDARLDLPDLGLCHLAAFLGIPCPKLPPLDEVVKSRSKRAHIVVHNTSTAPIISISSSAPVGFALNQWPAPGIRIAPGAIMFELVGDHQLTVDGYKVTSAAETAIDRITKCFVAYQSEFRFHARSCDQYCDAPASSATSGMEPIHIDRQDAT